MPRPFRGEIKLDPRLDVRLGRVPARQGARPGAQRVADDAYVDDEAHMAGAMARD